MRFGGLHFPGERVCVYPIRGVAQSGRAPALGAGCRRFESCLPDHFFCEHAACFCEMAAFLCADGFVLFVNQHSFCVGRVVNAPLTLIEKPFFFAGRSLRWVKGWCGNLGNGGKPSGETERLISRRLFCRFCVFSVGWHHQKMRCPPKTRKSTQAEASCLPKPGFLGTKRPRLYPSHTRAPARESLQREVLGDLFERGLPCNGWYMIR